MTVPLSTNLNVAQIEQTGVYPIDSGGTLYATNEPITIVPDPTATFSVPVTTSSGLQQATFAELAPTQQNPATASVPPEAAKSVKGEFWPKVTMG